MSADIAVPEHQKELRFYSRVLSTGENPRWREDLMSSSGTPIIGLGKRTEAHADLPLQWMPHIQVVDLKVCAERAVDSGGTVLMEGKDHEGKFQWAVLLDPNGAAFGIIPIVPAEAVASANASAAVSADKRSAVGRIAWLDLTVPNASQTRDFYQQVVGWSVQKVPMGNESDGYRDYNMLRPDGTPTAGICHARGPNLGLPAVWMIYLPVADLEESLRRVEEEGGEVIKALQGQDGQYAYAAVKDPVGVSVALMQESVETVLGRDLPMRTSS